MKILCFLALILFAGMAYGVKEHDYTELVEELKKPAVEVFVAQIMSNFRREDLVHTIGGEVYDIARTGVGCGAGIFGGLDTGFTVWDILSQDFTDFGRWMFAIIYSIAWWQQNGQYITYMCTNFWHLIH